MTLAVVTLEQANRYVLRRQHLITACKDPLQAVRDACGLQAQIPSTPALSLRARVARFKPVHYDSLLDKERSLVRTWAMRGTVHVVPSALLPRYTVTCPSRWWTQEEMAQALGLLSRGPQTRQELSQRAVAELGLSQQAADRMFGPWGGILSALARAALTVHTPNVGGEVRLARAVDWLGYQPEVVAMETLEDCLLADYLHGYGPASVHDFAHFLSATLERVRPIFARAVGLAQVRLEGSNRTYYLPEADLPELISSTGKERVPVHLLPRFDSVILVHKDKSRLMDPKWQPLVFKPAAVVDATVLIRGRVAGTWSMKQTSRSLHVTFLPFGKQPSERVEAEARRLADWFGLERLAFEVLTPAGT